MEFPEIKDVFATYFYAAETYKTLSPFFFSSAMSASA